MGLLHTASRIIAAAIVFSVVSTTLPARAADIIREEVEPGAVALVKHGRNLGLEIRPPRGEDAQRFLQKYLAIESEWVAYRGLGAAFIPIDRLKPRAQRIILLAVYPRDYVDENGWHHTVVDERETLWSFCEWVTGPGGGTHYKKVAAHPENQLSSLALKEGQTILVPRELLRAEMRTPTPEREPRQREAEPKMAVEESVEPAPDLEKAAKDLKYVTRNNREFAVYQLKKGEALYTSVVVRFTDIRENADIHQASKLIAEYSGIRNINDIDAGEKIYIPTAILSDRFQPQGSEARESYEAVLRQAERLKKERPKSKDLDGVVVILDPGHGGKDHGTFSTPDGLYEDEINYDIVCRIKKLLEDNTGATVHVTMVDRSQGFASTDAKRFRHDTDEELLTSPRHRNDINAKISVNLRWMLVNSIFDREVRKGSDPNKIIFSSIHTDALYNTKLRGAMIYLPGASLRKRTETRTEAVYSRYEEGRSFNKFSPVLSELRRDEALSRNFAEVLLEELGTKRIKRHDHGDPIRTKIWRSRNNVFVPAVLRNTKVPTKVLVETANMQNPTDRTRLADPWWRQQFALAYVDALKRYFEAEGSSSALAAMAD